MRQRYMKLNNTTQEQRRHVVRVTVLGLSGITVQRHKCRDIKSSRPYYPAPPCEMRALVAFTTTTTTTDDKNKNKKKIKGRTEASYCLEGKEDGPRLADRNQLQKHVAVWGGGKSSQVVQQEQEQLGSVVTFEDCLTDTKSFGLTIAMAEEGSDVALPLGVSNIDLSGDLCQDGHALTLHIPVVPSSREKTSTTTTSADLTPLPMIAVPTTTTTTASSSPSCVGWRKKKKSKNLLRKKTKNLPSARKQEKFRQVYGMVDEGSKHPAVLRILLEVYEKGSDLEKHFVGKRLRGETVDAVPGSIPTIHHLVSLTNPSPKKEPKEEEEEQQQQPQEEPIITNDKFTLPNGDPVTPASPSKTVNSTFSMMTASVESQSNWESEGDSCWGSVTVDDTVDTIGTQYQYSKNHNIEIVHDDVDTITSTVAEDPHKNCQSFLPLSSCMMEPVEEATSSSTSVPTYDVTLFGRTISIPTCGASFAAP